MVLLPPQIVLLRSKTEKFCPENFIHRTLNASYWINSLNESQLTAANFIGSYRWMAVVELNFVIFWKQTCGIALFWLNQWFFSTFHIHPLYCIDDDHFHCKLQIGFHPSIRIRVISFRFLLFAATIVQTLVCNRSLLEIQYMSNTHQQISMEDVVLYETNREALSALCSVVKHAGSGHSTKV